ncbi:putative aldo-keto reductase family 1 member C8 [Neomonachus schauinslandi]|uniref:Aldo-keto reductase family 1 member C8 n=1 Tax=Neomonachus schauinslandi TaxID=29088 RepID=A0A2Y9HL40_NEOSC|nr:putative aldo-keto reductase family 1 member C8 [Neomonachus schauinslandi]
MDLNRSCSVKLNDGHIMPVLGFGTLASNDVPKSKAGEATKVVIDVGFRHFDAAYVYQNEEEVGKAIREKIAEGTVKREDTFYTTKLWTTFRCPELVRPALERSLKALQLDSVDLFITFATRHEDLLSIQIIHFLMRIDNSVWLLQSSLTLVDDWQTTHR